MNRIFISSKVTHDIQNTSIKNTLNKFISTIFNPSKNTPYVFGMTFNSNLWSGHIENFQFIIQMHERLAKGIGERFV